MPSPWLSRRRGGLWCGHWCGRRHRRDCGEGRERHRGHDVLRQRHGRQHVLRRQHFRRDREEELRLLPVKAGAAWALRALAFAPLGRFGDEHRLALGRWRSRGAMLRIAVTLALGELGFVLRRRRRRGRRWVGGRRREGVRVVVAVGDAEWLEQWLLALRTWRARPPVLEPDLDLPLGEAKPLGECVRLDVGWVRVLLLIEDEERALLLGGDHCSSGAGLDGRWGGRDGYGRGRRHITALCVRNAKWGPDFFLHAARVLVEISRGARVPSIRNTLQDPPRSPRLPSASRVDWEAQGPQG